MDYRGHNLLCILALVAFIVGAVIVVVDDTLDVTQLWLALFVGLALHEASHA